MVHLAQELFRSVSSPETKIPNEIPKWYHLPGTGFQVKKQVEQLSTDIRHCFDNHQDFHETINTWFNKIRGDVYGFSLEYLKGEAFLPFEQVIEPYNGTDRVKPANYGDKPMVDLIDAQERKGAVKKGLEKVEDFLLAAPVGSIVVRTSPPGGTGLYLNTREGEKEIVYQDTQTQIYEKISCSRIRSYTIRTEKNEMDVEKNQQLLEFLGVPEEKFSGWENQSDRLSLISGTNAYLLPGQIDARTIIEKMRELTGDRAYGNIGFDQVLWGLDHFAEIMQIDGLTLEHTNKFIAQAEQILTEYYAEIVNHGGLTPELTDELEFRLGTAVLDLSDAAEKLLPDQNTETPTNGYSYTNYSTAFHFEKTNSYQVAVVPPAPPTTEVHYQNSLSRLQSKPGCAGGGSSETRTDSPVYSSSAFTDSPVYSQSSVSGPRSITLEKNSSEKNICPDCGGDGNTHFHCPSCSHEIPSGKGYGECAKERGGCGMTKEKWAAQTGVKC